ncbi:hypothetical protein EVAR_31538_1 [Eumeta japonica]|uniref:Uncharacterized protein n=1 Tax=Eumeta variegata TaxID=151549 RepID=A0A4C1V7K3_EUMVA|nr:hypothetical protein EVAR_31538_1 [Eumeta japonica]
MESYGPSRSASIDIDGNLSPFVMIDANLTPDLAFDSNSGHTFDSDPSLILDSALRLVNSEFATSHKFDLNNNGGKF